MTESALRSSPVNTQDHPLQVCAAPSHVHSHEEPEVAPPRTTTGHNTGLSLRFAPHNTVHYGDSHQVIEVAPQSSDEDAQAFDSLVSKSRRSPRDIRATPTKANGKDAKGSSKMTLTSIFKTLLFSKWIAAALLLLLISNVLFLCAFITNGWGKVTVEVPPVGSGNRSSLRGRGPNATHELGVAVANLASEPERPRGEDPEVRVVYWEFGLWQCCRNTDDVCIGTRWPGIIAILLS